MLQDSNNNLYFTASNLHSEVALEEYKCLFNSFAVPISAYNLFQLVLIPSKIVFQNFFMETA